MKTVGQLQERVSECYREAAVMPSVQSHKEIHSDLLENGQRLVHILRYISDIVLHLNLEGKREGNTSGGA